MYVAKNRIVRILYFIGGTISFILGFIGAFLPLLPTTPFMLLAAFCFMRSSVKAHQWLYRQPIVGTALIDWEKNKSISRKTKFLSIGMILISIGFIWVRVPMLSVKIGVTLLLLCTSTFIATRNEKSS